MNYFFLAIIALIVGSFLNLLIYRLPIMLEQQLREDCGVLATATSLANDTSSRAQRGTSNHEAQSHPMEIPRCARDDVVARNNVLNLWLPRSFCPLCKHQISWLSNIPLISYCLQKGRCRHCRQLISIQYPLVEVFSLIGALGAAFTFGFTPQLFSVLLFIWILIPLLVIDIQHQLLPDELTLSLLWLGLLTNIPGYFCPLPEAVLGAVCAYLILWVVTSLFKMLTGKTGMGQGDLKLFAALGAWFGWQQIPELLLLSSLTGLVIGFIYLKLTHQSKETPIPFGPFLCLAGLIAMFH
ncbi:MAG: A24 family peptidase [Gammaproteobacteria bacterium]|nr:A24 family peptidase [Gammaproteobacteria bacterium]